MRNDGITASTVVRSVGAALTRAVAVLAGSTLVAHQLAARSESVNQSPVPDYPTWLVEALSPTRSVQAAVGRTLVLTAAAAVIGALLGVVLGLLRRRRGIAAVVGAAEIPLLALALPGVALYPAIVWLADQNVGSAEPAALGRSFGDGLRFAALWALPAALVVASVVASAVGGGQRRGATTVDAGQAMAAGAPLPRSRWWFGVPTVAVALALAAAELLSGLRGVFTSFFDALIPGGGLDLVKALDLTLWAAVAVALVTVVVDVIANLGTDRSDEEGAARTVDIKRAPVAFGMAILAVAVAAAVVGAIRFDGAVAGNALSGPIDGAPLGTDDGGRNSALAGLSALAYTGVAAVTSAVAATALGGILVALAGRWSGWAGLLVCRLVDLFNWPVPLLLGLAVIGAGRPETAALHPLVVGVAAVAFAPMAAGLLGRLSMSNRPRAGSQWPAVATTVLYLSALALAAHVVIGLAGLGGGDPARDLGDGVLRAGEVYQTVRWPYLAYAGAVAVGIGAILAAAVPLVGSVTASSLATNWRSERLGGGPPDGGLDPNQAVESVAEDPTTDTEIAEEVDEDGAVANGIEQPVEDGQRLTAPPMPPSSMALPLAPPASAPQAATGETTVVETAAVDPADDAEQADGGPVHIRDLDGLGDDPDAEEFDVEINLAVLASVTRTVELRPSALRRAGITRPPLPSHRLTPTTTWSKPALAARPTSGATPIGGEPPTGAEQTLKANLPEPPELPDPPALPEGRNGENEGPGQERRNS